MPIDEDYTLFAAILSPYIGEKLELGRKYLSPIPRGAGNYEGTPSFSVFEGSGRYKGYLLFKDWGWAAQKGSRPVDLVMAIHSVDRSAAEDMLRTLDLPAGKIRRKEK